MLCPSCRGSGSSVAALLSRRALHRFGGWQRHVAAVGRHQREMPAHLRGTQKLGHLRRLFTGWALHRLGECRRHAAAVGCRQREMPAHLRGSQSAESPPSHSHPTGAPSSRRVPTARYGCGIADSAKCLLTFEGHEKPGHLRSVLTRRTLHRLSGYRRHVAAVGCCQREMSANLKGPQKPGHLCSLRSRRDAPSSQRVSTARCGCGTPPARNAWPSSPDIKTGFPRQHSRLTEVPLFRRVATARSELWDSASAKCLLTFEGTKAGSPPLPSRLTGYSIISAGSTARYGCGMPPARSVCSPSRDVKI